MQELYSMISLLVTSIIISFKKATTIQTFPFYWGVFDVQTVCIFNVCTSMN